MQAEVRCLGRLLFCSYCLVTLAFTACGEPSDQGNPENVKSRDSLLVGQEVWIKSARIGGSAQARALAEKLRQGAMRGDDMAAIARAWSHAPGAKADGSTGVLNARD